MSRTEIDGQYERARLDKVRADKEELELAMARSNLVIRDDVHKVAFEASRKLRDNLHALCKQAAPSVIGMTKPEDIEMYLRDEIDRMLEEFIETCV